MAPGLAAPPAERLPGVEDEPLGTGGGIRNVAAVLSEPDVLVFNGDVLSGLDPAEVVRTHRGAGADVTLHLVRVPDPSAFGCVPTSAEGRVLEFLEKTDHPPTDLINVGCYAFRREMIDSIPAGRPVSVERETFPGLLASGARVHAHVDASYWLDLGTPAAFAQGSSDLVRGRAPSPALPGPVGEALLLPGAAVHPDARAEGGSVVGAAAVVHRGAQVVGSVLMDRAVIEPGALVQRSVVGAGGCGCCARRSGGRRRCRGGVALRAAARSAGLARGGAPRRRRAFLR